jgi:16S rRNA processing protein RimM
MAVKSREVVATLGSIVKVVGLRGELKLLPGPDFWPGALDATQLDLVSKDDARINVHIERYRAKRSTYILKFVEFDSIDDVESLVGSRLDISIEFITEGNAPSELKPFQVIGAEVRLEDGERIGVVVDMLIGPVQNCLIVETDGHRIAVPVVDEVLIDKDLENGVIVINPPEGLLDLRW